MSGEIMKKLCNKHPSWWDFHYWLNGSLEVFFVVMYREKLFYFQTVFLSAFIHLKSNTIKAWSKTWFFSFFVFCQSLLAPSSSSTMCYSFCWHPDILESSIKRLFSTYFSPISPVAWHLNAKTCWAGFRHTKVDAWLVCFLWWAPHSGKRFWISWCLCNLISQ